MAGESEVCTDEEEHRKDEQEAGRAPPPALHNIIPRSGLSCSLSTSPTMLSSAPSLGQLEHGSGLRVPGIDDGSAVQASAKQPQLFSVPARMGIQELDCRQSSFAGDFDDSVPTSGTICLTSSEAFEESLRNSAADGAFTYESMDVPSPEVSEQFTEALNSLQGAYSSRVREAAFQDSRVVIPGITSDSQVIPGITSKVSVNGSSLEFVTKFTPAEGTQTASAAIARNVSRRSTKSELSYAELLGDTELPTSTISKNDISPRTPVQRSPAPASPATTVQNEKRAVRKKRVSEEEEADEIDEGPPVPPPEQLRSMLQAQKQLFYSQVGELEKLMAVQLRLTGSNPLSSEMAISAMGAKAGRTQDEPLSSDALKVLRDAYALKDTVTSKEARELSISSGASISQVKDFFTGQQARVRRILQMVQDELGKSTASTPSQQTHVPEGFVLSSSTESFEKMFEWMRSESSFTGQSRLLQMVLQTDQVLLLRSFLEKGGLRVISRWLTQAVNEEQTTVIRQILKVLHHLPITHAPPGQLSPIATTIKALRFYFVQDVATKARNLITKWSKLFARGKTEGSSPQKQGEAGVSQEVSKTSSSAAGPEKKKLKTEAGSKPLVPKPPPAPSNMPNLKGLDNSEKPPSSTLTVKKTEEDPAVALANRKRLADLGKEKRRVLLVEETGATNRRVRESDGSKKLSASTARPLSTDEIKKAKMRARLLQATGKGGGGGAGAAAAAAAAAPAATTVNTTVVTRGDTTVARGDTAAARGDTAAARGDTAESNPNLKPQQPRQRAPETVKQQHQQYQAQQQQASQQQRVEGYQPGYQPAYQQPYQPAYQQGYPPQQAYQGYHQQQGYHQSMHQSAPQGYQSAPQGYQQSAQQGYPSSSQQQGYQPYHHPEPSYQPSYQPFQTGFQPPQSRPDPRRERLTSEDGQLDVLPPAVLIEQLLKRVILPWSVPPAAYVDPAWNVAVGEESGERDAQQQRAAEAEEYAGDPAEEPKEPCDEEPEYDDSLTPVAAQSDDEQEAANGAPPAVSAPASSAAAPPPPPPPAGHDPQLLALLLSNPALVSELTSGKGLQALTTTSTATTTTTTAAAAQQIEQQQHQEQQQQEYHPNPSQPPPYEQQQQQQQQAGGHLSSSREASYSHQHQQQQQQQHQQQQQQQQQQYYSSSRGGQNPSLYNHAGYASQQGATAAAAGAASAAGYGSGQYILPPQVRSDYGGGGGGGGSGGLGHPYGRVSNNNLQFGGGMDTGLRPPPPPPPPPFSGAAPPYGSSSSGSNWYPPRPGW